MNCDEIKIWIKNASDEDLHLAPEAILEHIHSCEGCRRKVHAIQQAFEYMNLQKQSSLSIEKSNQIIDVLLAHKNSEALNAVNLKYLIPRIAAILIIAFGFLIGIIAGGFLSSDNNTEKNPWRNEFILLSENTENVLFD